MAIKKQTYINAELEWAEQKLLEWKQYVDDNPFQNMKDRIEWKPTAKGGMIPMVIASIESQIKCVRDTMKEYLVLLEQVEKMRQAEESKKKDVKGGADRPSRMGG
jgi:hypothetical protein